MKALKKLRYKSSSPLSRREKTVDASGKTKSGGLLGQNKTKRYVSNPFGEGKDATVKNKKRFGRTVETTRSATGKSKTVTKKDGTVTKLRNKGAADTIVRMENGGKIYGKRIDKRNTNKSKTYQQEGLAGNTRSLTKDKVRGGAKNNTYKSKTTTYDEGSGTVTKKKRTMGGKTKEKTRKISGAAAHRAIKDGMGKHYKEPNKEMKDGGKVVAQGATRKDVRRERRQARRSGRRA